MGKINLKTGQNQLENLPDKLCKINSGMGLINMKKLPNKLGNNNNYRKLCLLLEI